MALPSESELDALMKRCQTGFGRWNGAVDQANELAAECYGAIGMLRKALAETQAQLRESSTAMFEAGKIAGGLRVKCTELEAQIRNLHGDNGS